MAGKHELVELFADAVATAEKAGLVTRGQLLELLDKAPSSFGNEMNPWPSPERKNKLGIEDAHTVLKLINDSRVVQRMAHDMGYYLVPLHTCDPDAPDLSQEILQGYEATSAYLTAANSGASYQSLISALPNVIKELEDVAKRARMEHVQGRARPAYMKKAG